MADFDSKNPAFTKSGSSYELRDRWGNPLEVHTKAEVSKFNVAPAISGNENSILIWSKGSNGKNEWGRGDDVCPSTH